MVGQEEKWELCAHLERLGVPGLDLLDRRHLVKAIWKVIKFLDSVGQTDGELFSKELGGAE